MQPDLNRLRVFYQVHRHLSITAAADELNITPSAVSQQLKKLEGEIHSPLFTRLHKRLVPTPAGKKLYDLMEPLITELDAGIELMEQERTEPSGLIKIGAPLEFGTIYLPHVIAGFRDSYEKVIFEIELGRPSDIIGKIASGELDFAFVDTFPAKEQFDQDSSIFKFTPIIEEQVVLACSKEFNDEQLANDHSLESLQTASFISQQKDARSLNNWFRHHFYIQPKKLNIVLTVANHQAILSGVRNHLGLGVIVPHVVWNELQQGEIIIVREKEQQATNRISLVQLRKKTESLREKIFLSHFHQAAQSSRTFKRFNLNID